MRKTIIALAATLATTLAAAPTAGAHRLGFYDAEAAAVPTIHKDCGRSTVWWCGPNWPRGGIYWYRQNRVGFHSWHVRGYYTECFVMPFGITPCMPINPMRNCHTTVRITHTGSVAAHHKYCP